MVKLFFSILLLGTIIFFGTSWESFLKPCVRPISYTLGAFDERFGISREKFLASLSEAEVLWERALVPEGSSSGIDLFAYDEKEGELIVNLIYDYRQETTDELSEIEGEVKAEEASYRALEADYRNLKSRQTALDRTYEQKVEQFNQKNRAYKEMVERWNAGPRTSRSEFEVLESERKSLEKEAEKIRDLETRLNNAIKEVNEMVAKLNALAKNLNLDVDQYNAVGAMRGETFEGGTYTKDASGERIDIYEFENHVKLVRILAHELGHALGLDHVEEEAAIMFRLNASEKLQVSSLDLVALKALCKIE